MTDVDDFTDWDDRDREPSEPDFDALAEEEHFRRFHPGASVCDCPVPAEEEIAAQWAEEDRKHRAEVHGGGPCDCEPPF